MAYAVRHGYTDNNPVRDAERPRGKRTYNNDNWYDVKTSASNRRVDLGPTMMSKLKEWKLACPPNSINLIFPNGRGNPINHNNLIKRQFYPALDDAELPRIRFHDLRHTYESLLIEQGENIKFIQTQLGHSKSSITINVYGHLIRLTNQEAALKFEKTVLSAN